MIKKGKYKKGISLQDNNGRRKADSDKRSAGE